MIGEQAFSGCVTLTVVSLPETVNWMGDDAFSGCTKISDFTFTSRLQTTSENILKGCTDLSHVSLPLNAEKIGAGTFDGCTKLTEIELPETLSVIGSHAFRNTKITDLNLPDNLAELGNQAFYGALANQTVRIPASISDFGADVFGECDGILIQCYYQSEAYAYAVNNGIEYELIGDSDNPFLIDNGVLVRYFGLDTEVVVPSEVTVIGENAFKNKAAMTLVVLPEHLTLIEAGAFANCRSLENIVLPDSVTEVGEGAFADCSGFSKLTVLGTETTFGSNVFLDTSNFTAYVLYGSSVDAYFSETDNTVVYLADDMPVEEIVLEALPDRTLGDNGVTISGCIYKHGQPAPNAKVRLAYQAVGDAWWTYASADFMACDEGGFFSTTLNIPEEQTIRFKVEAKTSQSDGFDINLLTQDIAVYHNAFPASALVMLMPEKKALLAGESLSLTFQTQDVMDELAIQTQIEYGQDGTTWQTTGDGWDDSVLFNGNSGQIVFSLPADIPEGDYYFRLNLRAEGRETTDTSAECMVLGLPGDAGIRHYFCRYGGCFGF